MSDAARRKERKRLKREKKKHQMCRALSGSPYKYVGQTGALQACYVNSDWQTGGMATIHVVRHNPRGGMALACFLIDLWCAGLKDAWGALDLTTEDIDRHLDRTKGRLTLIRIDPDAAKNLVAGAIRFARQNGFRLPHHYERWTRVLGAIPDIASADLCPFGKDGGLLWMGPMDDLRRRLIGCSLEDFLDRPDVVYVAGVSDLGEDDEDYDEDDYDDDDDDEDELTDSQDDGNQSTSELEEILSLSADQLVQLIQNLCNQTGEKPSPLMHEAAMVLLSGTLAMLSRPDDDDSPSVSEDPIDRMERAKNIKFAPPMREALDQMYRLMRSAVPSDDPANELS
jgi:hypothetical protein